MNNFKLSCFYIKNFLFNYRVLAIAEKKIHDDQSVSIKRFVIIIFKLDNKR